MIDRALILHIKREEGVKKKGDRHVCYVCSKGARTIGYGRNLDGNGISEEEAEFLLAGDLLEAVAVGRRRVRNFDALDPVRRGVVLSMIFQLGETRFRKFVNTIAAIEREDWVAAGKGILNSLMARHQREVAKPGVEIRAEREARAMVTGKWDPGLGLLEGEDLGE